MKRKNIILVMLAALSCLFAVQSCKKASPVEPTAVLAAMPSAPAPAVDAVIPFTSTGQAINLTWEGTATKAINWSVYFGTAASPALVASNVATNAYSTTVSKGGTYYWQVSTTDANNETTTSPVWSFEVNSNPNVTKLATPANNAIKVSNTVKLVWSGSDPEGDNLTYDVLIGTTATPATVATGVTDTTYAPTLAFNTTYYWQIVAHDPYGGVSKSAVNTFTTDVFHPDFSVFKGIYSELCPTTSATRLIDVYLTVNTTTHVITMFLPIGNAMLAAGWGTSYSGAHPIQITYDPVTFAVTSTNQLLLDSFPDPIEQGPIFLQVSSGTIDAPNKKISIKWTITPSTPEFGGVVTTGTTTYTLRVQK
jgi:hypothetical protein